MHSSVSQAFNIFMIKMDLKLHKGNTSKHFLENYIASIDTYI